MFSIFRKKNDGHIDMTNVYCDMHSHLIPGIDDGAPDMEVAVQLIRGMHDLGYRKIVTTPHVQWETYQNTNEIIRNGQKLVSERLNRDKIDVEFLAAAEYFLDDHFDDMLT